MGIVDKIKRWIFDAHDSPGMTPENVPPGVYTVGEMQTKPLSAWGNEDIITGLRFSATMQSRTPLRVLLRHGEIHTDSTKPPPQIALERWEGMWSPITKTFRELGLDVDEPPPGDMASEIGYIPSDGGDYLLFLIAVREIVESHDTAEQRIGNLEKLASSEKWRGFPGWGDGVQKIENQFFPFFLKKIPSLTGEATAGLRAMQLDTPNRLGTASDETLLNIKGIGPFELKHIRKRCLEITKDRDSARLDEVRR